MQLKYDQTKYLPEMLRRHVAYYLLKNPDTFEEYARWYLQENNESYESYCMNIFYGNIWADDLVAAAIGKLFNISITIISPAFEKPLDLFHEENDPDVVLILNGGGVNTPYVSTHFSGTRRKHQRKLPGEGMDCYDVKIYENPEAAKTMARSWRIAHDKRYSLRRMVQVNSNIGELDKQIKEELEKLVSLKTMRNKLENDLISLGVTVEQLASLRLEGDSYSEDHPESQPCSSSQKPSEAQPFSGLQKPSATQPSTSEEPMIIDSENPQDMGMIDPSIVAAGGATGGIGGDIQLEGISQGAQKLLSGLLSSEGLKHLPCNKSLIVSENRNPQGETEFTLSTGPLITGQSTSFSQEIMTATGTAQVITTPVLPMQDIGVPGEMPMFPPQQVPLDPGIVSPQQLSSELVMEGVKRKGSAGGVIAKTGKFYCPKCGKEYSHRSTANKHLKGCGIESVKDFKCEHKDCGEAYGTARGLLEHNAAQHTKEYLYFCKNDGCSRTTEGFYYMSRASEYKANCLYKNVAQSESTEKGDVEA